MAPLLVVKGEYGEKKDLIYTVTGDVLASGYTEYGYDTFCKNAYYIYGKTDDGKIDIFHIQ